MKQIKESELKSKSIQMAVSFSLLLSAVILVFAILTIVVIHRKVKAEQNSELYEAVTKIKNEIDSQNDIQNLGLENNESNLTFVSDSEIGFGNIPYYISFIAYQKDSDSFFVSNDPFLPILPTTKKPATYIEKDFYIDGDLNILYLTLESENAEIGKYIIQASINMDNDYGNKLVSNVPRSLLFLAIPIILISFLAAFILTHESMKPIHKMFEREKQFTSDVSHELKTPLSVIQGHANLIRRWGKDDPAQLEQSIGRLLSETKSMEKIVENLLMLSRLDSGRINLTVIDVDVNELFTRLKEDTTAWAENVTFSIKITTTPILKCDSELIYEALTIIVSNSIKYANEGEIKIEISLGESDGKKIISVLDNGSGIPKDKLPHVFERFFRADESHNRKKSGSGLGLSIVKSIMTAHNGNAKIDSDGKSWTKVCLVF